MVEARTANTTRIDTIASNARTRATQRRYAYTGSANTPATSAARPGANTLTSSSIARSAANYAHMASERRDAHNAGEAAYAHMANERTSANNAKEAATTAGRYESGFFLSVWAPKVVFCHGHPTTPPRARAIIRDRRGSDKNEGVRQPPPRTRTMH